MSHDPLSEYPDPTIAERWAERAPATPLPPKRARSAPQPKAIRERGQTTTDAPPTNLVAALHHYLACCEQETRKARTARNREALSLYEAGVPVSQLAGILGATPKAVYNMMDSVRDWRLGAEHG